MSKDWKAKTPEVIPKTEDEKEGTKDYKLEILFPKSLPDWFSERVGVEIERGLCVGISMTKQEFYAVKQCVKEVK